VTVPALEKATTVASSQPASRWARVTAAACSRAASHRSAANRVYPYVDERMRA